MPAARAERAPAKVNLTLRVVGQRPDGYHDIESLVAFAGVGDTIAFAPGRGLSLTVRGPTAMASGNPDDNLVLKAARALAVRVDGLKLGHFELTKRLPVAAGVGGGSTDAAAALRLLARTNQIAIDDARLLEAARVTGADVPVCLDPRARVMRGIGDILCAPVALARLPVVLINPGVAVPTKDVFQALHRHAAMTRPTANGLRPASTAAPTLDSSLKPKELIAALVEFGNDLEAPAIGIQPVIADVLAELRSIRSCRLARMSGSGATCFGLFGTPRAAAAAAKSLRSRHPTWWVRATGLQ